MTHPKTTRVTAGIGVGIVAASAAVISFHHVQKLARSAGEPELTAWLLPLSIDGAVAAAAAVILADAKARRRPTLLTWLMLILGLGASLAANIASAEPTWTARAIAAWPPIALALGIEVLAAMGRRSVPLTAPLTADQPASAAAPRAERPAPPADQPTHGPLPPARPTPRTRPSSRLGDAVETLHLVPARPEETPEDLGAVELIRQLDAAAPQGQATRRAVQEALGCGASRATRLIALARQTETDLGESA